jgi:deoxyribonuclease-4
VKPLIGAHVSIAGGISKAPDRGLEHGCNAIQVFVKSPSQWQGPPLTDGECQRFKARFQATGLGAVAAHDSYLINLASSDRVLWKRSLDAFLDEMMRCARLGIGALVMHPGSHRGAGEAAGIRNVVRALSRAMKATRQRGVRILLETTAGQGDCLGARFEQMIPAWGSASIPVTFLPRGTTSKRATRSKKP